MNIFNPPRLKIRVKVSGDVVECELIKTEKHTLLVKLPDGSIIKRKLRRDVV